MLMGKGEADALLANDGDVINKNKMAGRVKKNLYRFIVIFVCWLLNIITFLCYRDNFIG